MSHDINRYLEIMRRTGLPVIVATGEGEPVVVMPLDAYETLLGPSIQNDPVPAPPVPTVPAPNPSSFPAYDPMEEQASFPLSKAIHAGGLGAGESGLQEIDKEPKTQAKSRKLANATQSAEDRFFLEPLE